MSIVVGNISTAVFYYTIGNIDPALRSTLRCIQLVACVTTPILQKYGYEMILKPFIQDANKLFKVHVYIMFTHACVKILHYMLLYALCTKGCQNVNSRRRPCCERCSSVYSGRYIGCPQHWRVQGWGWVCTSQVPDVSGNKGASCNKGAMYINVHYSLY